MICSIEHKESHTTKGEMIMPVIDEAMREAMKTRKPMIARILYGEVKLIQESYQMTMKEIDDLIEESFDMVDFFEKLFMQYGHRRIIPFS